jgi:hypothetical protein
MRSVSSKARKRSNQSIEPTASRRYIYVRDNFVSSTCNDARSGSRRLIFVSLDCATRIYASSGNR